MPEKNSGEKTEKPTPKKRLDARKKGMAARSSELPQAVSLVAAAIMLPMLMPGLLARMAEIWRTAISPQTITDPNVSTAILSQLSFEALKVFVPMTAATTLASLAAQLALNGGRPNPHKLKPQWKNLNPIAGLKRLVSVQVLWDFGRTLAKLGLLVALTWGLYGSVRDEVLGGSRVLSSSLAGIGSTVRALIIRAAIAALLVGLADAAFNKRRFTKQIRMTKQEVKEDAKQAESSPQVKAEIRRRQAALSRNRMITSVAQADVVITNPTRLAIALSYDAADGAPRVLAKGAGVVAKRIRQEATKHGVPIRESKPLVRAMFRSVEVDQLIPAEFFAAVATVLAAVYRARQSPGAQQVKR